MNKILSGKLNLSLNLILFLCLYLCLCLPIHAQSRGVYFNNSTSSASWDSLSFGMISRQVLVIMDSDGLNDTLYVSYSSSAPNATNTIILLGKYAGESVLLSVQARFIKTKGSSALIRRRIIVN